MVERPHVFWRSWLSVFAVTMPRVSGCVVIAHRITQATNTDLPGPAGSVVFPESGAIRFGVFAITRAMGPSGSLGDRFAREVVRAGRWAIQRSGLRLELSGDAGVLRFTRQPVRHQR